ncbi:MAG: EthD domain-containing protein [Pirellulales bacterium]|nr:EthD domain-containing protein [Pirellulales bacterium]
MQNTESQAPKNRRRPFIIFAGMVAVPLVVAAIWLLIPTAVADILERPPYRSDYGRVVDKASDPNTADDRKVYENRGEPMYVLPAFLMRPDLTPESERPRDPHNLLDKNGDLVDLETAKPEDLAFDPNPYHVSEKWNEYWRKIHGMRFTHKDSPDDRSMALMLRYDQVHRISSGPTSFFPPPYQPPVDENGQLHSELLGKIPAYQRPKYDGFAYMAFNTLEELQTSFGQGKFPAKIVPEERIMFRSVPHLIAKEYIIIPNRGPRGAIMLVKIHRLREGIDKNEWQRHWRTEHADLVLGQTATHRFVTRYAQLHNVGPEKPGELFWHPVGKEMDGITVMEFANMSAIEDFLVSPGYRKIEADERRHLDLDASVYWTAINHNIIDKIVVEVPTRRE